MTLWEYEYEAYKGRRTKRASYMTVHLIAAVAWMVAVILIAVVSFKRLNEPESPQDDEIFRDVKAEETVVVTPAAVTCELLAAYEDVPKCGQVYYDIPFDCDMQDLVREACQEADIPFELALAVIWRESTYRNISGDSGASIGYMQVQPKWHWDRMERLGVTDLTDPYSNFRVGCDYIAELLDRYPLAYALTAYNSGKPGLSKYSESVMSYMDTLLGINADDAASDAVCWGQAN